MISIIGAGPGGSTAAELLAKQGHTVDVYEEHAEVGMPVACTGIITGILEEHLQLPKRLIVNVPEKARIFAPSGKFVDIKLKNDVILDRAGLDQLLADRARKAGAVYHLRHRYRGHSTNGNIAMGIEDLEKKELKEIETDLLVGADGPYSRVAKHAQLNQGRKYYAGLQYTATVENENIIEFYPLDRGIAWVVPETSDTAKVGIATEKQPYEVFDKFMKWRFGDKYGVLLGERQAGAIPLYDPRLRTQRDNVYLVGDAAGMVKAPTLGGINQSIISGQSLADAIKHGADYEKIWRGRMGRDLYLSLLIRKMLNRSSAQDINKLVALFQRPSVKQVLEQVERDVPSKFAFKLLAKEPRLLLYARFLL